MENSIVKVKVVNDIDIEVLVAEEEQKKPIKERRGGRRVGAGRPALVRLNKERMEQGLEPIPLKPPKPRKRKSEATLPVSKKQRHQEILAEMLGKKSKSIVQKILNKALDDNDKDQMECMKIVVDRVLPKEYFAKAKGQGNSINIQIMGVGGETIIDTNTVEADYEEIEDAE